MRILHYDSLGSTNSEAARLAGTLAHGDIIITREQTAGRGQRGNSWESEPGMNLTFSLFLRPRGIMAANSFLLSMAAAIGIADGLKDILKTDDIAVKWPNDIYWRDLKLAGILIENSFTGINIDHSIVGIGLNVNQRMFLSDAPNPVSMSQISGCDFNLSDTLRYIVGKIIEECDALSDTQAYTSLTDRYHTLLWRRNGTYLWHEPGGEPFKASISNVAITGHLTLTTTTGINKSYAFKEIFPVM